MIGERLAELRKINGDTQQGMANKLHATLSAVRCWEQEKSSPSHEMLIAICKLFGTSADYLLGLTDIDPSDEARKQRQRLTEEEQTRCTATKNICCGNAKNKPSSKTVKVAGRLLFCYGIILRHP